MNDESTDEPATRRALRCWIALARCYNALSEVDRGSAARYDLIPTELGVLEMLHHKGPLTLGEVRERLLVTSGSVTYVVDKLERQGLVRRVPCPADRRVIHAELTDAGRLRIAEIFPAHAQAIAEAMAALTPEEQEIAAMLLVKLGRAAAAR